jgi:GDP-D-mannose 3', 5'-epimerase
MSIKNRNIKKALVLGAGGFIGSHLVKRLKKEGFWVRGVDLKQPEFNFTLADHFILGDLRNIEIMDEALNTEFDEIFQLAADMGGTGFIGTGENDADIMHNSAVINLNLLKTCDLKKSNANIFYSSSACVYPEYNQIDPQNPNCAENTVYPAEPDTEYGWEKLFSERLYQIYRKNKKLKTFVARYHNIFGPEGTWDGGREKVPAAICRKLAVAKDGDEIEVWGDGMQTRSFLYIDECIEGTLKLIRSNFHHPINIGSDYLVTINDLVNIIARIANKNITIKHIDGPLGVRGRVSDNKLIKKELNWEPDTSLINGLNKTYPWILKQVSLLK